MPGIFAVVLIPLNYLPLTLGSGHFAFLMPALFNCLSSSLDPWWPFCFGGLMLWAAVADQALVGRLPAASNELPPISSSSQILPLSSFLLPSSQTPILLLLANHFILLYSRLASSSLLHNPH